MCGDCGDQFGPNRAAAKMERTESRTDQVLRPRLTGVQYAIGLRSRSLLTFDWNSDRARNARLLSPSQKAQSLLRCASAIATVACCPLGPDASAHSPNIYARFSSVGRAAGWAATLAVDTARAVREAHFPFSQSAGPTAISVAIRSDCERFTAVLPLGQQLFLSLTEEGQPVTYAIIDVQRLHSEQPPHGERWGARLARLGLLLVHCLLRPFLASPPPSTSLAVDTRPMHRLEQQPSSSSSSPTKSLVAAVFQRLSMELPAAPSDSASPTNSSSEPSPQAADSKPNSIIETKHAPSPPPSPKLVMVKEIVPEQDQLQQQQEDAGQDHEQEHDEVEELKQTLLRQSTGSIAIMTRQQEAFDHRRHTFSAMSADGRANMRRRSYDLTAQSGTFPPTSPSQQPLQHSLKAHHHLQHLRVYGKSTGPSKQIGEFHEEGAPLMAFVSPNPDTVWTRGKPVNIEWKVLDFEVDKLCIELLEDGLSATTLIAKEAPNTGFFTYHKVPWGMESGSKYFLRVSAADDPERFRTSSFFQISSAP